MRCLFGLLSRFVGFSGLSSGLPCGFRRVKVPVRHELDNSVWETVAYCRFEGTTGEHSSFVQELELIDVGSDVVVIREVRHLDHSLDVLFREIALLAQFCLEVSPVDVPFVAVLVHSSLV